MPKIKTFRSYHRAAAKSFVSGQGFHSLSFDGEHRIVNRALAKKITRGDVECRKVLSENAKLTIRAATESGRFHGRSKAKESPFMAPSENPDKYSPWCSFCKDFGECLVLCAGCRVGVCTNTDESSNGCLDWDPIIDDPNFVFYCPLCAMAAKRPCALRLRVDIPHKMDVPFRYDPPVLIVSATWHQTKVQYSQMLRDNLLRSYYNNEGSVMLMVVSLDNPEHRAEAEDEDGGTEDDGYRTETTDTSKPAEEFLEKHPTAKIVVVIDTHCLENGYFVWTGDSKGELQACSLLTILRDCIPPGVFKYISNAKGTPEHRHRSLILNLACGNSVIQNIARRELLNGHCADAVLSLANRVTVVGEVAPVLTLFVMRWVQTPSDYDTIIAATMPHTWIQQHKPVLSRYDTGHILYSKFSFGRPGGQVVLCHRRCGQQIHDKAEDTYVKFTCLGCRSTCTAPKIKTDQTTALGRRAIVKGKYPPEQFPTEWKLSEAMAPAKSSNRPPAKSSKRPPTKPSNRPPSVSSKASVHLSPPGTMSRSISLPVAPTPSSSSLTIKLPARRGTSAISRSPSTSGTDGRHSAMATPPPPSPHEPVSTEPPRKRSPAEETDTSVRKKNKNKK